MRPFLTVVILILTSGVARAASGQCHVDAFGIAAKITCTDGSSAIIASGSPGQAGQAGANGAAGPAGSAGGGLVGKDPMTGLAILSRYIGLYGGYESFYDSTSHLIVGYSSSSGAMVSSYIYYASAACAGQTYVTASPLQNMIVVAASGGYFATAGSSSHFVVNSYRTGSGTCSTFSGPRTSYLLSTASATTLPTGAPTSINLPLVVGTTP